MNLTTDNLFRHSAKSIFPQISNKYRPLLALNGQTHTHTHTQTDGQDNPHSSTSQPKQTDTSPEITCCLSAFLQMYFLKVKPQSHTDDKRVALLLKRALMKHQGDQEYKLSYAMILNTVYLTRFSRGSKQAPKQGWKKLSESKFGHVRKNIGSITTDSEKKHFQKKKYIITIIYLCMDSWACMYFAAASQLQNHTFMDFHVWWLCSYKQCFPILSH